MTQFGRPSRGHAEEAAAHEQHDIRTHEGFTRLVEDHGGIVAKIARTYSSDPNEIEDIQQHVFLTAWRKRTAFNPARRATPSTWLYVVAQSAAVDWYRQNVKRQPRMVRFDPEQLEQVATALHGEQRRQTDMRLADEKDDATASGDAVAPDPSLFADPVTSKDADPLEWLIAEETATARLAELARRETQRRGARLGRKAVAKLLSQCGISGEAHTARTTN